MLLKLAFENVQYNWTIFYYTLYFRVLLCVIEVINVHEMTGDFTVKQ